LVHENSKHKIPCSKFWPQDGCKINIAIRTLKKYINIKKIIETAVSLLNICPRIINLPAIT